MALKKRGLQTFQRGLPKALDRGVERAAGYVADLASQLAPYDATAQHKHLNESIVVRGDKGSGRRRVVAGDGLPDARAIFQEYGTDVSEAQPYLTPAIEAIDVRREIKKEVQALARKVRP
jgi:HK97 gp10 family phage protein